MQSRSRAEEATGSSERIARYTNCALPGTADLRDQVVGRTGPRRASARTPLAMRTRAPRRRGGLDRGRARLAGPQMEPRGARGCGGRRARPQSPRRPARGHGILRSPECRCRRCGAEARATKAMETSRRAGREKARPMAEAKGVRREKLHIGKPIPLRREGKRRGGGCCCRSVEMGRASQRRTVAGRGAVPRFVAIPTGASGPSAGPRPLAHGLVARARRG